MKEQIIEIIKTRIKYLEFELSIVYMGEDYYNETKAALNELQSLLDEIKTETQE